MMIKRLALASLALCVAAAPSLAVAPRLSGADGGRWEVSPQDSKASGSAQTTTGSIAAGSASLSVASKIDFAVGQGVRIPHAGPAFSTASPTGLAVAPTSTTGSTSYSYQIAAVDAAGGVGAALSAVSISNGPASLGVGSGVTLTWSAPVSGTQPAGYAIYGRAGGAMTLLALVPASMTSWEDQGRGWWGSPDWVPAAPQASPLADDLVTTISTVGSSTLALAAAASSTASGVVVSHDDTAALTSAIASGRKLYIPAGTYNVCAIPIYSQSKIVGAGSDVTFIRHRPGCNSGVFVTDGAAALFGTNSQLGVMGYSIEHLTVDGDRSDNAAGHGLTSYGWLWSMRDVIIRNAPQSCVRSEWGPDATVTPAAPGYSLLETTLSGIRCDTAGQIGMDWNGPHDAHWEDVVVGYASVVQRNRYDFVVAGVNAGGLTGDKIHPWGASGRYCLNVLAWNVELSNSSLDGCYSAGALVQAPQFRFHGRVYQFVSATPTAQQIAYQGIILGVSGGNSASDYSIDATFYDVAAGAIVFANASTRGWIRATGGVYNANLQNIAGSVGLVGVPPGRGTNYINISNVQLYGTTNVDYSGNGAQWGTTQWDPASLGYTGMSLSPQNVLSIGRQNGPLARFSRQSSTGSLVDFFYGSTAVGSISTTGSATAFNTTSDYRLKENVEPLGNALDRLSALRPVRFDFKSDPSQRVDGFLAHEVASIVPEAVTGGKDAVDVDGKPVYQQLDHSKLVPLAIAAEKELLARVIELEACHARLMCRLFGR